MKNKKAWSETATMWVVISGIVIIVGISLIISFSMETHFKIYNNESGEMVEVDNFFNLSREYLTMAELEETCEDVTAGMETKTFRCKDDIIVEVWEQMK